MRGRPPSLRARLLLAATVALLLALTLVGLAVDRAFQGAAQAAMEERLESTAFLVLATLEVDEHGRPSITDTLAESRLDRPGSGLHAGAITPYGSWESPSLLGVVNPPNARVIERGRELFRGPEVGGNWNVWALGLGWEQPGGEIVDLTIWAAEDPERLKASIAGFRADLWRWLVLAAGLVIAAQFLILMLLFKPLRRVAREISQIEQGQRESLDQHYPKELQPLTANLNALLTTERANAEQYQRALADLAHALKTPLAVIRARLAERRDAEALALKQSVDQMRRLVRHELDRAALSGRRTMLAPVAVREVLERMVESLGKLYPEARFELVVAPGLKAYLTERDLMELAGNLIENAAKSGGGRVRVAAAHKGSPGHRRPGLELTVEDDGPGMDPERFEDYRQRGVRGDERREGQGLGLSIVDRIVRSYDGRLKLFASELGGAGVRVELPPR